MPLVKSRITTKSKQPSKGPRSAMPSGIKKISPRSNPPSASYKKIAVAFVICTILLILVIVYFSFSKATITLVADQEQISQNVQIKIAQNIPEGAVGYLKGYVTINEFEDTKTWPVEQGEKQEGYAKGLVTVVNTHNVSQTLVKTTRLLTPDNVLFRIQRTIIVPAGGQVQVVAQADRAGESGNIGPTRFTIPGLNEFLRKKIYAESYQAMTGGVVMVGTLTQEQIDKAVSQFTDEIYQTNLDKMELPPEAQDNQSEQIVIKKNISQQVNQEIGEKVDSFDLTLKIAAAHLLFDKTQVLEIAKLEVKKQIGQNIELINYNIDNFNYILKEFNWETQEATLNVSLGAWVKAQINLAKINKSELKGMNQEALTIYFGPIEEIKEVKVRFWPFWVKTIPTMEDHIEIKVKE